MTFRPFSVLDHQECCAMMDSTWRFTEYFPHVQNAQLLTNLMFDWYLHHSDYAEIAGEGIAGEGIAGEGIAGEGIAGRAVGCLFAGRAFRHVGQLRVMAAFGWNTLRQGVRGWFRLMRTAWVVLREYRKGERALKEKYVVDAEIFCLFVADSARGCHVGSALLSRYFDYARKNDITRVCLITDSDCNYGFYDRAGFRCVRTVSGTLGVGASNGESFLYEYTLSE